MDNGEQSTKSEGHERFLAHLVSQGNLTKQDISRLERAGDSEKNKSPLIALIRLGLISSQDIVQSLSSELALPLFDPVKSASDPDFHKVVTKKFMLDNLVFPYRLEERPMLAMVDPLDADVVEAMKFALDMDFDISISTIKTIEDCIKGIDEDHAAALENSNTHSDSLALHDKERLLDIASDAPAIRLIEDILEQAINDNASDVHFEPVGEHILIRLRINGLLETVDQVPKELGPAISTRLKIIASLDIGERRMPQDGRFHLQKEGKRLDFRVSVIPTLQGESVVLRLLDRDELPGRLSTLGFSESDEKNILSSLAKTEGLFLVTGPTGSGKTTTLYSILRTLNTGKEKILTIEDPVEYQLQGVMQLQVQQDIGLNFAKALRAFLRQDPDIILVGEIRDKETAEIAIHAALTGHLVLSTLHTQSAVGAITRLLNMGIPDYLLSSTLKAIVGQRLIRCLCPACNGHEDTNTLCKTCNGTRYANRVAISETMLIDEALREIILQTHSENEIQKTAVQNGMRLLKDHAESLLKKGMTDKPEIARVLGTL